ncbi:hypothetical protein ABH944_005090 [Caballeronia udeis]|jgi:hypothetical protein|uniref:Uncharacterized protein n=1 Tax=Caballeronia udeis TaxID=1232866 RepID=A0ABW8MMC6_9BURK
MGKPGVVISEKGHGRPTGWCGAPALQDNLQLHYGKGRTIKKAAFDIFKQQKFFYPAKA